MIPSQNPSTDSVEVPRSDLRILTEAILENLGEWVNDGWAKEWRCQYCGGSVPKTGTEALGPNLHSKDCVVLLAISLQSNFALP